MNTALDFVLSAIDNAPRMPAGIATTCSHLGDIDVFRVTLAKGAKSRSFDVGAAEAAMLDSDQFLARIHQRLEAAIAAVNGARVPKKRRLAPPRKAKAGRMAKSGPLGSAEASTAPGASAEAQEPINGPAGADWREG